MATTNPFATSLSTPLFWDLHLHGAFGLDFMHVSTDEAIECARKLHKRGIGYFAPTLLSAEPQSMLAACERWGALLEKRAQSRRWYPKDAAIPIGLHLEGPFLNPKLAGAHPPKGLKMPDQAFAQALISKACGHVAIVTLAPELPGAKSLIAALKRKNIRIQAGHTTATTAEAERAVSWGVSGVTHLFNAMRIHHRDAGWLSPLVNKKITAEIITDGEHVAPEFLAWAVSAAGSQLYAVSDSCSVAGCSSRHMTTLGDLRVEKKGKVAVVTKTGTIAGGADFLTDHPRHLRSLPLNQRRLLELFYKPQSALFPGFRHSMKLKRNVFCAKSLKFQGIE